ncbi:GIY-YIG nuclease family protein [Patescibacteria group bacterium]|nr:GIY-YIG nuclease family protein [Patescibacteria group bacterium]
MYYVYIIKSIKTKGIYIGSTNDLRRRFVEHNSGKSFSTKHKMPWKLIYYEAFLSEKDARERERQLKNHGQANGHLKKRIANSLKI